MSKNTQRVWTMNSQDSSSPINNYEISSFLYKNHSQIVTPVVSKVLEIQMVISGFSVQNANEIQTYQVLVQHS